MITLLFVLNLLILAIVLFALKKLSKYKLVEADLKYHINQPYYTHSWGYDKRKKRVLTDEEKTVVRLENKGLNYDYVSYIEHNEPLNKIALIKDKVYDFLELCFSFIVLSLLFIFIFNGITYLTESNNIKKRDYLVNYAMELNEEVEVVVNTFIEYEGITFDKEVSLESLVVTYPELRSVELVNNQLSTLKQTKESIKSYDMALLKYETINKLFKFWR